MQPRSCDEQLSVCPSVCQTRELRQNEVNFCTHCYTTWKINASSFPNEEWLVEDVPLYQKFWAKLTHSLQKRRHPIDIRFQTWESHAVEIIKAYQSRPNKSHSTFTFLHYVTCSSCCNDLHNFCTIEAEQLNFRNTRTTITARIVTV